MYNKYKKLYKITKIIPNTKIIQNNTQNNTDTTKTQIVQKRK